MHYMTSYQCSKAYASRNNISSINNNRKLLRHRCYKKR